MDVSAENWEEGTNAKQQAFNKLREEKDKMFVENQIFKKFRGIFKGLKRKYVRAKQPNKLTEYEIPIDTTRHNRIIKEEEELYGKENKLNTEYKSDAVVVPKLEDSSQPESISFLLRRQLQKKAVNSDLQEGFEKF